VRLDWTLYPAGSNTYVARRKQVVNPNDKTFDGAAAIATVGDPTRTYDDPVLNDGNDYNYRVFRRALSESLYFYHTDHLGTPIAMTSGAASFVWRSEHRPFGGVHSLPVSTVANNLRFPGQYSDSESGLHQNWSRDYHNGVGRYSEPDSIGLAGGPNPYAYVSGNPVRSVDPYGLYQCTYAIATHEMTCTPNDPRNPAFSSSQYVAGNNLDPNCTDCQNNPNRTGVRNRGPLPTGTYKIEQQRPSSSRRDLTPSPGNTMFGRFAFQVHGCRNPASCSEGCIAATTNQVRDEFNRLMSLEEGNNTLTVVP
jgi:RHS repeat-associated protein